MFDTIRAPEHDIPAFLVGTGIVTGAVLKAISMFM